MGELFPFLGFPPKKPIALSAQRSVISQSRGVGLSPGTNGRSPRLSTADAGGVAGAFILRPNHLELPAHWRGIPSPRRQEPLPSSPELEG